MFVQTSPENSSMRKMDREAREPELRPHPSQLLVSAASPPDLRQGVSAALFNLAASMEGDSEN